MPLAPATRPYSTSKRTKKKKGVSNMAPHNPGCPTNAAVGSWPGGERVAFRYRPHQAGRDPISNPTPVNDGLPNFFLRRGVVRNRCKNKQKRAFFRLSATKLFFFCRFDTNFDRGVGLFVCLPGKPLSAFWTTSGCSNHISTS